MVRRRTTPVAVLVAVLASSSVASCGDDGPDRSVGTPTNVVTVHIERSRFSPPTLQVASGTTVRFVNDDAYAHTVTASEDRPVAFDSGELGPGDIFVVTFEAAGTYPYFCRIHPTMRALVTAS